VFPDEAGSSFTAVAAAGTLNPRHLGRAVERAPAPRTDTRYRNGYIFVRLPIGLTAAL